MPADLDAKDTRNRSDLSECQRDNSLQSSQVRLASGPTDRLTDLLIRTD